MHYYFPFQKLIQSSSENHIIITSVFPLSLILRQGENTHFSDDGAAALLRQRKRQERAVDARGRREDPCICSKPWDWQLDLSPSESRYILFVCLFSYMLPQIFVVLLCFEVCTGLNRCGKSCRLRWTNYLRPDLKHDGFTPEEEECILEMHRTIGSRYTILFTRLVHQILMTMCKHTRTTSLFVSLLEY